MMFLSTVSQSLGPEMVMKFIHPDEAIKRLAASQGIDTLSLIKTKEEQAAEMQSQQAQAMQGSMVNQMGDLAKAPLLDPSKNPEALDSIRNVAANFQEGNISVPTVPAAGA
jgi:hypothetical protein